ncbi:MAG: FkbM family methyltransferase, partial [Phormidesmis sp.]
MNFSAISNQSVFGKALRMLLRLLPDQTTISILQGPLKGKKWIVGAGQHGCWLGSYEYEKQEMFKESILEGSVVFDIGAHVGFYTLLSSILVGHRGKVFTFEPLPRNLFYLKRHLKLNHVKNVKLIEAAVSDSCDFAYFDDVPDNDLPKSYLGKLSTQGKLQVKTVSLDELLERGEIVAPTHLKIDVEGAELLVLKGARKTLVEAHPMI